MGEIRVKFAPNLGNFGQNLGNRDVFFLFFLLFKNLGNFWAKFRGKSSLFLFRKFEEVFITFRKQNQLRKKTISPASLNLGNPEHPDKVHVSLDRF